MTGAPMTDDDLDTPMRMEAFEHVRRLGEVHDHLTADELKPGGLFSKASASPSSLWPQFEHLHEWDHPETGSRCVFFEQRRRAWSTMCDPLKRSGSAIQADRITFGACRSVAARPTIIRRTWSGETLP